MEKAILLSESSHESAAYVPYVDWKGPQGVHAPSRSTLSGAHTHSDCEICACARVVIPCAQVMQEEFAVPGWKLPYAHGEQCSVRFSPVEK